MCSRQLDSDGNWFIECTSEESSLCERCEDFALYMKRCFDDDNEEGD